MRIFSPAKINLHLRIGPLAADGFHPLLSWMCTVGLSDTMEMRVTREPGIKLSCDKSDVPVDEKNLIVCAGRALAPESGAEVFLEKKIPMGGGLGGGSSNAAFALMGLNKLWDLNLSIDRLAEIGAKLGSDVPFFLRGPSSVCEGRGERVTPIDRPRVKYAVLFFPSISMATPAVYRRFDEMKLGKHSDVEVQPDWNRWVKMEARQLLGVLVNDLEAPAFSLCAELGELRARIERKIGRIVRMSGSGSTLFTLADEAKAAEDIAALVLADGTRAAVYELGMHRV